MRHSLTALRERWNQAGKVARAIVAKRVGILTGSGLILGELVRTEVIPLNVSNDITHWAGVTLSVLGVVTGVLWAQSGTTPADPQLTPTDLYGHRLVSELDYGPHAGITPPVTPRAPGLILVDRSALDAAAAIHPAVPAEHRYPPAKLPDLDPPTEPNPYMGGG